MLPTNLPIKQVFLALAALIPSAVIGNTSAASVTYRIDFVQTTLFPHGDRGLAGRFTLDSSLLASGVGSRILRFNAGSEEVLDEAGGLIASGPSLLRDFVVNATAPASSLGPVEYSFVNPGDPNVFGKAEAIFSIDATGSVTKVAANLFSVRTSCNPISGCQNSAHILNMGTTAVRVHLSRNSAAARWCSTIR